MKILKPSEAKQHAQQMVAEGKMPSLEELLSAVGDARQEFGPKIKEARQQAEVQEKGTEGLGK